MASDNGHQGVNWHNRFKEVFNLLPNDERRAVTNQCELATGYAWGYQDASQAEKDTQSAINFCYAYGEHAAMYALGRTAFRRNVPDAYLRWVEGKPFS